MQDNMWISDSSQRCLAHFQKCEKHGEIRKETPCEAKPATEAAVCRSRLRRNSGGLVFRLLDAEDLQTFTIPLLHLDPDLRWKDVYWIRFPCGDGKWLPCQQHLPQML